jgi:hypothetical protein
MNTARLTSRQLDAIQEAARLDAADILAEIRTLPKGRRRALLNGRLKNRVTISARCQQIRELLEEAKKEATDPEK